MASSGQHRCRLPLYGPLHIKNLRDYLDESKKKFELTFSSKFSFDVKLENFELLHLLGQGSFGRVVLAKYKLFDNSFYAIKAISKSYLVEKKQIHGALHEKHILQSIDSPFCVRLEYFSQDNSNIYFFLPFVCGGEMFTHLQRVTRFEENLARFYAAQVVLGLEYLHHIGLVYRDLKPENILIDHFGFLKITHFGFSKVLKTRTYTFCGTPDYIAPEIILGTGYGKAVDWWALGVLIFKMNAGYPPFVASDQMIIFIKILKNQYLMPKEFGIELKDIIRKLVQVDVTRRYGNLRSGVEDIKQHPWFRKMDWMQLLNRRVAPPYVPPDAQEVNTTYFPDLKKFSSLKVSQNNKYKSLFDDF